MFQIPRAFDLGATFLWAISGALMGLRKRYDATGVFILAMLSSTGGGLLRDSVFLQKGPPLLVSDWRYLAMNMLALAVVAVYGARVVRIRTLITLTDALGVGAYAVVGMDKSIAAGLSIIGIILVGVVNAAGGAFLRDIVVREEPEVMRPGEYYATIAFVGCIVFVALWRLKTPLVLAAWVTIILVFVLRLLTIRYGWQTRPITGWFSNHRGPES
jgi:uncharacterized membrane protein YeiH